MFACPVSGAAKLVPAEVSMVWDVSFTCDICGKKKGEANHWWMLSNAECACDEDDQVPQRFSVMPWNAEQSRNPEMRHLCGKGCAMQALERFMTQRPALLEVEADDGAVARSF
jgi:hypothetical protein